jgi:uncharacterized protein (DUF952 family)
MRIVVHLMPAAAWDALAPTDAVTNASLDTDGFIHCTDDAEVLLRVANAFYRSEPGPFVALHIDVERLSVPCVWEEPAHISATSETFAPRFPHVYGPIDRAAVVTVERVARDAQGRFTGYDGFPDR